MSIPSARQASRIVEPAGTLTVAPVDRELDRRGAGDRRRLPGSATARAGGS